MTEHAPKLAITFHGGAGTVTGSNFLIEYGGKKLLIDCGLFQGSKFSEDENRKPFPYEPSSIDALIVTHPHLDHIGRVPLLVRQGFSGPIYSTPPTRDLAEAMLIDSMGVLEKEARRDGSEPLYEEADVERSMRLWKTLPYHQELELPGGLTLELLDSGHVLGAAMAKFSRDATSIVFTGDLGNTPSPLLRDTESIKGTNYLVMESIYGDRNHEPHGERRKRLEETIESSIKRGGVLMIPAFSLERTQEILFEVNALAENKKIPRVPMFLDSPLAIKVTGVYGKYSSYLNAGANALIDGGDDIFNFPGLVKTLTTEESKRINDVPNPKIILAGSGMSNGGRIIHHEKRYLPDPKSTLLLIGYQAVGTLGRILQEGAKEVTILGERVPVRASIVTITGYSAHKDSDELVNFVAPARETLRRVFVAMGEPRSSLFLAQRLRDYLALNAFVPEAGERVELDF